jgi:hypothetical protein
LCITFFWLRLPSPCPRGLDVMDFLDANLFMLPSGLVGRSPQHPLLYISSCELPRHLPPPPLLVMDKFFWVRSRNWSSRVRASRHHHASPTVYRPPLIFIRQCMDWWLRAQAAHLVALLPRPSRSLLAAASTSHSVNHALPEQDDESSAASESPSSRVRRFF